jgi:hypothetical protein
MKGVYQWQHPVTEKQSGLIILVGGLVRLARQAKEVRWVMRFWEVQIMETSSTQSG